ISNQTDFDGFWIESTIGSPIPTFHVDDIVIKAGALPPPVTNSTAFITVNVASNRHAINPLIYGLASASSSQVSDLNVTLNRLGGNAETRYNWQIDAHNRGADFYFESIGDSSGTPGTSADNFVSSTKTGGAQPLVTIPMIGWMPKLGPSRAKLASYSIIKY